MAAPSTPAATSASLIVSPPDDHVVCRLGSDSILRAEHVEPDLDQHVGQAERDHQAGQLGFSPHPGERLEQRSLQEGAVPEHGDEDDRQEDERVQLRVGGEPEGEQAGHRDNGSVGEVDHAHHPEHQVQALGEKDVHPAQQEAVDQNLQHQHAASRPPSLPARGYCPV